MYLWWKEKKKKQFFYTRRRRMIFLWDSTYKKTDWETTLLGHHVELGYWLEVFSSLVFEFHCKVRFLFFVPKFKVTCYLSWIKYIRVCCFHCMFCMRCKTKFSNTINYIFEKPALIGKISHWQMLLSKFDIIFVTWKAIKGQAIADYLVDQPLNDPNFT